MSSTAAVSSPARARPTANRSGRRWGFLPAAYLPGCKYVRHGAMEPGEGSIPLRRVVLYFVQVCADLARMLIAALPIFFQTSIDDGRQSFRNIGI